MLINLSNHPVHTWSSEQKSVAVSLFGQIIDWEFPHIEPDWSDDYVKNLLTKLVDSILALKPSAVYVVGEHVATFFMVQLFQKAGIRCINAKSVRSVIIQADGTESKQFVFQGFRDYQSTTLN